MGIKTELYRYQDRGYRKMEVFLEDGGVLLADEMGLGKAQPLTANVLTPDGWVKMGNLRVGDKVVGSGGRPVTVTGVYPQGVKKVYRVGFRDGSSAECCDDHLWTVQTPNDRFRGAPGRVLPLKEVRRRLRDGAGNCRFFVPLVRPVEFGPNKPLVVDPYLLGYLLANGCTSTGTRVEVVAPDDETVSRLEALLPAGTALSCISDVQYRIVSVTPDGGNYMNRCLRLLGMMGKKAHQKKVPIRYKWASAPADRLAVLQGLCDGDGWAGKDDGHVEFDTSSEQLAEDVQFLVQSLGGTASVSLRDDVTYTYKGEKLRGRPCWKVTIRMPVGVSAFRLGRKADRRGDVKYGPSRAIVSVKYVGEVECQCISVDAPDHLYVTDDFVLTHNSIQVLAYFNASRKKYGGRPAVVVCPAGLRLNWQNEFRVHLGIHASILEGHKADPFELDAKAYIIGYDTIGDVRRPKTWAAELKKKRPYLLVTDESQMLKSRSAKRTKHVLAFAKTIPKRVALSGTPLVNRPSELWTVLHMLRPDLYPSFTTFAMKHCRPERKPWGWEFKGAERMDELHHDLTMTMMIRRLKADVLKDLPPKTRHVVPLPLSNREEYETAFTDFMAWMRKNFSHRAAAAARAERLTKTGYMLRLAARLKLPAVITWVKKWLAKNPGKKLIVFGRHTDILEDIHAAFKYESVLVTGATPMKKRKESQALFQKANKCRLFVGNIDAAGAGWNGTAARAVAFVEYDWRPGMHKQCEDRAHRIGQHGNVDCYYLTAAGTIEEKMCQTIQDKQAVLDAVLDGGMVPDQLSVFDELMGLLL